MAIVRLCFRSYPYEHTDFCLQREALHKDFLNCILGFYINFSANIGNIGLIDFYTSNSLVSWNLFCHCSAFLMSALQMQVSTLYNVLCICRAYQLVNFQNSFAYHQNGKIAKILLPNGWLEFVRLNYTIFHFGWIEIQRYIDRWMNWNIPRLHSADHILYSRYTQQFCWLGICSPFSFMFRLGSTLSIYIRTSYKYV